MMHEQRVLWDRVALMLVPLVAEGVLIWWLESRFGSLIAVMTLGLLGGVFFYSLGTLHNQKNTKNTLIAASDFVHDLAQTEKARAGIYREFARGEREAFKARSKLDEIDYREVQRLSTQKARLLASEQSNAPEVPSWMDDEADVDTGDTFRYVE